VSHDVVPGAYADVYKATYEGKTVAVKKLNNAKGFKEFRTEVKFMSTVDHPNIVLLKGICLNPPCIITEFMELGTQKHTLRSLSLVVVVVMLLLLLFTTSLPGNLHSYLTDFNNKLTWKQCLGIAEDVAKGMNFLHSQSPPRIHRDLKSPNILVAPPLFVRPCVLFSLTFVRSWLAMAKEVWWPKWPTLGQPVL